MVKKMLKKITKEELISIIIFVISFLLFTTYNLADNELGYDRMWTFHMTQRIAMGEVPYKEINIIITPLFYQIGALIFNITGCADFAIYSLYGGLIGAFLNLMCYKVIKELTSNRLLSVFATIILTNITSSFYETNYNVLLLSLIFMVMFLEMRKEKSNKKTKYNIIIGVFAGLCAATKHTVGGVIILTTLSLPIIKKIYLKENGCLKEIINKFIGVLMVGVPYLIWLVSAGILDDFMNFAIFGMFDFAEKNSIGSFFNLLSLFSVSAIFAALMVLKEFKKIGQIEKEWLIVALYAAVNLTYGIPLFNFHHILISCFVSVIIIISLIIKFIEKNPKVALMMILVAFVLIKMMIISLIPESQETSTKIERWNTLNVIHYWMFWAFLAVTAICILFKKNKLAIVISVLIMFVIPIGLNIYMWMCNVKENREYCVPEYSCIGVLNAEMKDIVEINKYIKQMEAEGYNVYVLDVIASKYMIPLHRNNYKFDLMLNGNLGYNGEKTLIEEINEIENIIILRQKPEVETIKLQQPEAIDKFIEENYIKIGEINDLEIYN